jgi:hypothetical protein
MHCLYVLVFVVLVFVVPGHSAVVSVHSALRMRGVCVTLCGVGHIRDILGHIRAI